MPVLLKIDDGKPSSFPTVTDAVVYLLRRHCSAEEVQAIRLDLGRSILNTFEVIEHVTSPGGATADRPADSPATTARKGRDKADAERRDAETGGRVPGQ